MSMHMPAGKAMMANGKSNRAPLDDTAQLLVALLGADAAAGPPTPDVRHCILQLSAPCSPDLSA